MTPGGFRNRILLETKRKRDCKQFRVICFTVQSRDPPLVPLKPPPPQPCRRPVASPPTSSASSMPTVSAPPFHLVPSRPQPLCLPATGGRIPQFCNRSGSPNHNRVWALGCSQGTWCWRRSRAPRRFRRCGTAWPCSSRVLTALIPASSPPRIMYVVMRGKSSRLSNLLVQRETSHYSLC